MAVQLSFPLKSGYVFEDRYFTVGSLLPQYTLSKWFEAHSNLMLHDDDGRLVTVSYSLGCPSHRDHEPCGAAVAVPWVDISQPAAADAWVNGLYRWVANRSVDGIALDGNPFEDEWVREVGVATHSPFYTALLNCVLLHLLLILRAHTRGICWCL